MRKITLTLLFLSLCFLVNSQVLCGTAPEGGTVTLTAPPGNTFVSVEFASYGTPNGTCGSFTLGPCHAANSQSIAEAALIGNSSASISATNGLFGDPCGGTVKRLYIQARYSSSLPLKLVSFTASADDGQVHLKWRSENEDNFRQYEIERSSNGVLFQSTHSIAATGSGSYDFNDQVVSGMPAYYYRLKMVDQDGKYRYSAILKVDIEKSATPLSAYPSPAEHLITINSNSSQDVTVYNLTGKAIFYKKLIAGSQIIDISGLQCGIYIMKGKEGVVKFIKR
jgi:hypothetical protein